VEGPREDESESSMFEESLSLMDKLLSDDQKISDLALMPIKRIGDLDFYCNPAKKVKREQGAEITCLPPKILLKIFNYLPSCDILNRVVLVCELFHEVCKDPELRLSITIGRGKNLC
jgi:F-box-like